MHALKSGCFVGIDSFVQMQTKKEACESFKLIQTYMGDRARKTKKIIPVALDIIVLGWQNTGQCEMRI